MKTRIQKWGNSLARRIPKSFATEAQLNENTPVELTVVKRSLVILPLDVAAPTLDELLQAVTDQNLHGDWNTGEVVGK